MKTSLPAPAFKGLRILSFVILFVSAFLLSPRQTVAQCTNFSAFGSTAAPVSTIINITTCQFAGEYATITGCLGTHTYISSTDLVGGYFTVRQGASNGPVVGMGVTPLTWTTTVPGTYYVHLNLSAACGTDFSCHSIWIEDVCPTPAPTSVTATPSTVCAGSNVNLSAVSAGNTIYWYTTPSGGTPIGSSASGAPFAISPSMSGLYYASAFNGSCYSVRSSTLVTVNPAPSVASLTATPDTICAGNVSGLIAVACGTISNFTSVYAPANWTTTHVPITDMGTVNTGGAPASISMTSSNAGNFGSHRVIWTTTITCTGNVTFNWDYVTTDVDGPSYDIPEYSINGVVFNTLPGFNSFGANSQSGSAVIPVVQGQTFSLVMNALDDILGPATTVYTNFTAPGASSGTMNWYLVPSGGSTIGSSLSGATVNMTPGGSTWYYVQTTAGGCTSPRVGIQVVVQPCILPLAWNYFHGENEIAGNRLHWGTQQVSEVARFEVERSTDGFLFEKLGTVNAEQGIQDYSLLDKMPVPGENHYRVGAIGFDGNLIYSETIRMQNEHTSPAIVVYPNPSREKTGIRLAGWPEGETLVRLTDATGRAVATHSLQVAAGNGWLEIDARGLSPGHYLVTVVHPATGVQQQEKLVIGR